MLDAATNPNKEIVLQFMRLMDAHDFDNLDEVLTEDFQLHLGAANLDREQTEDMIRIFYNMSFG